MLSSNSIYIIISEVRHALDYNSPEDASLEERARIAMETAKHHWLAPSEEEAFEGALEGLYSATSTSEEDKERVRSACNALQALGQLLAGTPIDRIDFPLADPNSEPLRIADIWRQA